DAHVRDRSARAAVGAANVRSTRTNTREVVADAAAAAHRLRRLLQRDVDADAAGVAGNAVADRLHEAVDERRLEVGARCGIDAAAEDEAVLLCAVERLLP